MGILVALIAALIVGGLVLYVGLLLIRERERRVKQRSLAFVTGYASADPVKALAQAEQHTSLVRAGLIGLGMRMTNLSSRRRIEKHALYAGVNDPLIVDDTLIRKILYMVFGALFGLVIYMLLLESWWLAIPVFAIFAFWLPDILLYNKGIKRDEEMAKKLPDALDLLNLCVESGLGFQAAIAQVAANQAGPVAEEFSVVLQEMQLGRSRAQALEAMSNRTRQEDVRRFISAMLQVDKLGVPVSAVMREQAKEMRAKRFARAREQAQKVPLKILMPLMLCFLPALFIIILGPAGYSMYLAFSGQ